MGALCVPHRQSASTVDDYQRCAGLSGSTGRGATARTTSHAVRSSAAGIHAGGPGHRPQPLTDPFLAILHLCDSLLPVGAFAYSDGLEAAAVLWPADQLRPETGHGADRLRAWMDAMLDETVGRLDGPAVWRA